MAPESHTCWMLLKANFLLLSLCLLPEIVATSTSTTTESIISTDACVGTPCINDFCRGHPCIITKPVNFEFRRQETSPCAENKCDPRDQTPSFSPVCTNSVSTRSNLNPSCYPVSLARYLICAVGLSEEVEPRRYQSTGCPDAYCATSTTRSTSTSSLSDSAACRSMANYLRYLMSVIEYLVSAARADRTQATPDTCGQDEEAKTVGVAFGWQNTYRPSSATSHPMPTRRTLSLYQKPAPSRRPKIDLERHEYKPEGIDPRPESLNCWLRSDDCRLDVYSHCPASASTASRLHSRPFLSTLGFLLRWPHFLLSMLQNDTALAPAKFTTTAITTIPTPSITPPPLLHHAVGRTPQDAGSIPAQIAELPQSCTEISSGGVAVQMSCCWSPEAASMLTNKKISVCSGAGSVRLIGHLRWFRGLKDVVKVGVLGLGKGGMGRKQSFWKQSPLETAARVAVGNNHNDNGTLPSDLDGKLTDPACSYVEMNEDGKNARESLGLGSALLAVWDKARAIFEAANAWPRVNEESRPLKICGWFQSGGEWVEIYRGDPACSRVEDAGA